MKTCIFNICPRQNGKTKRLVDLYNKLSRSSTLPVYMIVNDNSLLRSLGKDAVYTIQDFIYKINSQIGYKDSLKCEHLLIDEYFLFSELQQQILYTKYKDFVKDTVWIETSPIKQYSKSLVNICKQTKLFEMFKYTGTDNFSIDIHMTFPNESVKKEFKYLYNNFLTDPATALYIKYEDSKALSSKETFETQFLGKFYKEEENVN